VGEYLDNLRARFVHYMTGIAEFDSEHWEMLEKLAELDLAIAARCNDDDRIALFDEMYQMLLTHWKAEKAIMDEFKYPYVLPHSKHHADSLRELDNMKRSCISGALSAYQTTRFTNLFLEHIDNHDMAFVSWLKEKGLVEQALALSTGKAE
jgi:hemerythrin-like metal-binding protein